MDHSDSDISDLEQAQHSSSDSDNNASEDEEIMAAIRAGLIKPGTTVKADKFTSQSKYLGKERKREKINNTAAVQTFEKSLTETIGQAVLSDFKELPSLTIPADENRQSNAEEHAAKVRNNLANDDFKREALFALEAKASVVAGLILMEKHGIPCKRPDDYYAEMAKSDKQMEKVKNKIIKKGEEQERREKLRKLRDQRKMGKEIQMEIKKKRGEEKKEFLKKVKQARKNKTGDALFDDDSGRAGSKQHVNKRREYKNEKFGFKKKHHNKSARPGAGNSQGGGKFGAKKGFGNKKASNASAGNRSKNTTKKRPGKAARGKK